MRERDKNDILAISKKMGEKEGARERGEEREK